MMRVEACRSLLQDKARVNWVTRSVCSNIIQRISSGRSTRGEKAKCVTLSICLCKLAGKTCILGGLLTFSGIMKVFQSRSEVCILMIELNKLTCGFWKDILLSPRCGCQNNALCCVLGATSRRKRKLIPYICGNGRKWCNQNARIWSFNTKFRGKRKKKFLRNDGLLYA